MVSAMVGSLAAPTGAVSVKYTAPSRAKPCDVPAMAWSS